MSIYTKKIIKESLPVLLAASVIASLGGIGLEHIKEHLVTFLPFFIMLPALNGLVGDHSMIMVAKFTTYLNKHHKHLQGERHFIHHTIHDLLIAASFTTCYIVLVSLILAAMQGFSFDAEFVLKMVITTAIVIGTMFIITTTIAFIVGKYIWDKHEDPDDVLLPITTSIADLGSMLMLSFLVSTFF
ncbi:MAG: magnesium transporter [Nanoarchaeota archaeon]|nr:magnesium transporter [Nanoarchaeota archaeon]